MNAAARRLVGTWISDLSDSVGNHGLGLTSLEFTSDGTLLYTIHEKDRDQIVRLTFRAEEPGVIISDQPSRPRGERTTYEFTDDGKLVLDFEGKKSKYRRIGR